MAAADGAHEHGRPPFSKPIVTYWALLALIGCLFSPYSWVTDPETVFSSAWENGVSQSVDASGSPRASKAAMLRERGEWIASQILPHEPELRRALRRQAPRGFEIDDIVQEIYTRLAAAGTIAHIHNPRGYMFRMAAGVMADYVRRQKVVSIRSVGDMDTAGGASLEPSPETIVADRDELRRLARILATLPAGVADVFRLRRIEGLGQREASRRLGVPESTVEKRMARGLFLVARALEFGGNGAVESTRTQSRKLRRAHRDREA